jgi:hypothetical protein
MQFKMKIQPLKLIMETFIGKKKLKTKKMKTNR